MRETERKKSERQKDKKRNKQHKNTAYTAAKFGCHSSSESWILFCSHWFYLFTGVTTEAICSCLFKYSCYSQNCSVYVAGSVFESGV